MKRHLLMATCTLAMVVGAKDINVSRMLTENMQSPWGIDTDVPRFSWQADSKLQDVMQTAYQIQVATSASSLLSSIDEGLLWDSGKTLSDEQLWIAYQGKQLQSNQRAYWRVRIWTNKGESDWSPVDSFSVGLLNESKWSGRWIGLEKLMSGEQTGQYSRLAARYLRREFTLRDVPVKRATAYVAGLGYYKFYVNGQQVGLAGGVSDIHAPMPSDYRKTIYYNTFDVTRLLQRQTALGIVLGNGYYFAMRQDKPYKNTTFGWPKCRVNVIIEYADGKKETWKTDENWRVTANGPIRANNIYDGEEYDARMEMAGWNCVGFDDSSWLQADRTAIPTGSLRGQMAPNVSVRPLSLPSAKELTQNGHYIVDLGQNLSGIVALHPRGQKGDTIRLRFAEKLNADGSLYTKNLRSARCEDIYVCNGGETKDTEWAPSFVWHGFRYVEVIGQQHPSLNDFSFFSVRDEMRADGKIETSNSILNKVLHNARQGIADNYHGMPLDCPQRDERMPWLGDRTVGALGESFLFDNERLYTKWMNDICDAQRSDGCIPDVAPAFWNYYSDDLTWPAALPFICDMLWRQFGNTEAIIKSYPFIKKWATHIIDEFSDKRGIITRDKYGDWCVPPESLELIHSQDPARITDGALISTAYMVRVAQLMQQFAKLLGQPDDAETWRNKETELTQAFNKAFLHINRGTSPVPGHPLYPDSVFYGNNTATANLLPMAFGIVPDDCREEVVKNVVTNIMTLNQGHISCGVIGISWLLRGLSDHGFSDVAWHLATQKTYPSWGYMTENGATTTWELWNGDTADPSMNSGNHVMLLGDLLTWTYQHLAGINQKDVAYKHIVLKPDFQIPDCSGINATFPSPYGNIESHWKKHNRHIKWHVAIPVNTTAEVHLPDGSIKKIGSGHHDFEADLPVRNKMIVEDQFIYEQAAFPSCHASTIVELKNGDLVTAWFGGKHENNPDVCIYVSRKKKGTDYWTEPILAADGVFELGTEQARIAGITEETTDAAVGPAVSRSSKSKVLKRKACWNPVLYEMPNGELLLFYKVGLRVADWTGWLVRSRDGGKTWSKHEALPEGFLGPIKNKPELVNGRLICPSSTEMGGWKIHFEIYDIAKKTWHYIGPIEAEEAIPTAQPDNMKPIGCIQPSILKLKDGRLQVLCRSQNGRLATSFSNDGGETWSKVTLTDIPNNQSGTDAVTLHDGRHLLAYNDFGTLMGTRKGPRTPLSLAISDDGTHWRHLMTLEDSPIGEYSYPAIIEGRDGSIHLTYTWRRERIVYKKIEIPFPSLQQ